MQKILNFLKTMWRQVTTTHYYTNEELSPEEFKKLWNEGLEEMKMK